MINEKELNISNKSYTKKDFASIYPELLDIIKNQTNRWDPQTSNESDPGIVLTKECAFIGDKINYNIDKNILERYLVSATQYSSMSRICEELGYYVNYYIAPTVKITFMYTDDMSTKGPFLIKKLDTVLSSNREDENDITYVLIDNVSISAKNKSEAGYALQGELRTLSVNTQAGVDRSKELIQLDNLDDRNRVYFPEVNVAQNGVFIRVSSDNKYWKSVKNLNYEVSNSKCFKFGFDSVQNHPYVEFPEDIADLIGDGLEIRYILTQGYSGNISANVINTASSIACDNTNYNFQVTDGEESDLNKLYIRNLESSVGGKDPETINEAYNGWKKTVGTFDTLVACRDYANAIYNMYDAESGMSVVSNVQVADRRDDINYCTKVKSYDELGVTTIYANAGNITAYDLCCYPLTPMRSITEVDYYNSFLPEGLNSYIKDELENSKTISHDYKTPSASDIYLFKNYLTLDANLVTTYKVNDTERSEIIANVEKALIKNFNAREIDYGYEIPYQSLVDVIENADKRIATVSLAEPYLKTKVLIGNEEGNSEVELSSADGADSFVKLASKNILAGTVSLFDYDRRFNYDFGQFYHTNISGKMTIDNLTKIKTVANITLSDSEEYQVNQNEIIQLLSPSIISKTTYPAYVYFRLETNNTHDYNDSPIKNDTNYSLAQGEKLYLQYTDSNDLTHVIEYGHDATGLYVKKDSSAKDYNIKRFFIQPKKLTSSKGYDGLYDIPASMSAQEVYNATGRTCITKTINGSDKLFFCLQAQETIDIRELNDITFKEKTPCYWIRNNSDNKLFTETAVDGVFETVLEDGEYFFYTDSTLSNLVSLGSGTTIRTNKATANTWTCEKITLEEVVEHGMLALKDYWNYLNLDSTYTLTACENSIVTLLNNDWIQIEGLSSSISLNNSLQPLEGVTYIGYKLDGETEYTPLEISPATPWRIKSRLDIDVSNGLSQKIYEGQEVTVYNSTYTSGITLTAVQTASGQPTRSSYFELNLPAHLIGSDNIDVTIIDKDGTPEYPMSIYFYDCIDNVVIDRNKLNYTQIQFNTGSADVEFGLPCISNENAVFMIYIDTPTTAELVLSVEKPLVNTIKLFNDETPEGATPGVDNASISFTKKGLYTIEVTNLNASLDVGSTIKLSPDSDFKGTVIIGTLDFFAGYNTEILGIDTFDQANDILDDILDELRGKNFYYNVPIDNSKAIELDANVYPKITLISPYAFYDVNNIANKFTLSEIDFKASSIDVVRSSRL